MTTPILEKPKISPEYLQTLQAQAVADKKTCVVGGLVVNTQNQIFVQKRAEDRTLFPGCWDIAGGHVEDGETLDQALAREIEEETGWRLTRVIALVDSFDWETKTDGVIIAKREFDFLVTVSGDLASPQIERDKFSEFRWVGLEALGTLKENRSADDLVIYHLVRKALRSL